MSVPERHTGTLRPRARLMQHLGEDLIPNDRVALVELVKNAYDADATTVIVRLLVGEKGVTALEVWDDGHGMSPRTVEKVWLEIATPNRVKNTRSESGARRVLGAKGLGRFAVARLAARLELVTRRKDGLEVALTTDWDSFNEADAFLDNVDIAWETRDALTFTEGGQAQDVYEAAILAVRPEEAVRPIEHGTLLRMLDPRTSWNEEDQLQLRTALSRLTPPAPPTELDVPDVPEFRIILDSGAGEPVLVGPPPEIEQPAYRLLGTVAEDGTTDLRFTSTLTDGEEHIVTNLRAGSRLPSCGRVKIDLRAWDLDKNGLAPFRHTETGFRTLKDIRALIADSSGVALYRDGFRVQPYGDADVDWLGLGQRRVNNPTMRLSNNQVVGLAFIAADENQELRDQANRQGLINNDEFLDLRNVMSGALDLIEKRRYRLRRDPDPDADPKGRDRPPGVFDAFDLSGLREVVRSRFPDDAGLNEAVEEAEQDVARGVREVQEVISRFSRLATLGSLVDIIVHEGNTAIGLQQYPLRRLKRLAGDTVSECADRVREAHDKLDAQVQELRRLFQSLAPLSGRRRGRPREVSLHRTIEAAVDLVRPELDASHVELQIAGEDTRVTVDEADVYQVVVNLLRNAIHWTSVSNADDDRHIVITTARTEGAVIIEVADNGPGVSDEDAPYVFDSYYTTRPGGTGLGLNIAGSILHDFYDGDLELVSNEDVSGATFRATLRRRIG